MHDKPHFDVGEVRITQAALEALAEASVDASLYLSRHVSGAAIEGYCVMSTFSLPSGKQLWIISEADRSTTVLLLRDDF